jgi:hypothetical protein
MPRSGADTLSDMIAPILTLFCAQCQRKGRYIPWALAPLWAEVSTASE